MKHVISEIINTISTAQNILVMPSSPPDGDSLGSALAIYLTLKKLNKAVTVVCADPIPEVYTFLPMIGSISNEFNSAPDFIVTIDTKNAEIASLQSQVEENKFNIIITPKQGRFSAENISFSHGPHHYDLIITVDTAELKQLGKFYEHNQELFSEIPVINIDHHASNQQFGRINFIDIMSSSSTELVLEILESLEQHSSSELIDADIATSLLAGIITDTGSFQHSNTTPRSFSNSAKLIRRGARQQEIIQNVYKTKQLSTLRLWGRILTSINVDQKHRLLWSKISQKDLRETGSTSNQSGDIIDELMTNAPEMDVVVLLKEKEDGIISGSIRTTSDAVDASEIAGLFGGGGHTRAAGFKMGGNNFPKNCEEIIKKIIDWQAKRLNLTNVILEGTAGDYPGSRASTDTRPDLKTTIETKVVPKQNEQVISKKEHQPKKIDPGVKYHFES